MIRALIAPTAFKGTLSSIEVAEFMGSGFIKGHPQAKVVLAPLADGGDGTIDVLHSVLGGKLHKVSAMDTLGRVASTHWLELEDLAVIELASICGIAKIGQEKLSPLVAHTYGLGQVIEYCHNLGQSNILITVGGSASTDGGMGALCALGACFFDAKGEKLSLGGGSLVELDHCDLNKLKKIPQMKIAVDVLNPLLGPNGAAYTFAPQKGANLEQCELLDKGLTKLADELEKICHMTMRNIPGAGAAGGVAFGLSSVFKTNIISGFAWIAEVLKLEDKIKECDLVISGEGKLDNQSFLGKVIGELAALCKKHNKPLFILPAQVDPDYNWQQDDFPKIIPLVPKNSSVVELDVIKTACSNLSI